MGDGTQFSSSTDVWHYGKNANIKVGENNARISVIAGDHTTFSNKNFQRCTVILGASASATNYDQTGLMTDGTFTLGAMSTLYADKNINNTSIEQDSLWGLALRGNTNLGSKCNVYDWRMKNDIKIEDIKKEDADASGGYGIINGGVFTTGFCSFTKIGDQNAGVVLYGSNNVIQCTDNFGVIIGGTTQTKMKTDTNDDVTDWALVKQQTSIVKGPGIYIRGTQEGPDPKKEEVTQPPANSLIQLSTLSSLATFIDGNGKLKETFNLQDSSGTYIFQNGKFVANKS